MTPIRYTNWDGLLNTGVSDFLLQNSELTACKNVWVYKLGKLQKVPGYAKCYDSQVINDYSVSYLHHYYDTGNITNYLVATSGTSTTHLTLKYRTTGAWATASSISTTWDTYGTAQPDMENFLGKVFIVGHKTDTNFLPNATLTATVFSAADTDLTNMPQGKFIVRYRDLLYVLYARTGAVTYPSRAYYCSTPVDGDITWTVATDFIEFGYDDGDSITGAVDALDRLLVFKTNSMWKYDESQRIKIADKGCDSFKSIIKVNQVPIWFNRKGFYKWEGAAPILLSAKSQEFIDAIDQTKLDEVVAAEYNGDEYRGFIGTVTVGGITYTNAWWCFNTTRNTQYIRCTVDVIKSACVYVELGKRRTYFGDDDGYVYKFAIPVDEVYTDNTQPIDSFFITKNLDHGVPEDEKFTNHVTVFTKYAAGMKMAIEANNNGVFKNAYQPILNKNIAVGDISVSGNRLKYKFYEKGSGKSWQFEGFVIATEIKEHKI